MKFLYSSMKPDIEVIIASKESKEYCKICSKHIYGELLYKVTPNESRNSNKFCEDCFKDLADKKNNNDFEEAYKKLRRYKCKNIFKDCCIISADNHYSCSLRENANNHKHNCSNIFLVFGGFSICTRFLENNKHIGNIALKKDKTAYCLCNYCRKTKLEKEIDFKQILNTRFTLCQNCYENINKMIANNILEEYKEEIVLRGMYN